ncbi:hypothetical protein [Microtetraspora malaysiensis]|uniref:Uncharacterized protein n=1 Tax=Microtetraspora malaysiensis TaxID=161358 RepID=A0ABW6T0T2_9ACTN
MSETPPRPAAVTARLAGTSGLNGLAGLSKLRRSSGCTRRWKSYARE